MPIGGRINRRDNLRSKTALTKTKDRDNNENKKQSNSLKPSSGLSDIVKNKSSKLKSELDSKIDTPESEVISKGLRISYVHLEDLKLNDENKTIIDSVTEKVAVRKKNKNKPMAITEANDKQIESPKKTDVVVVENLYDTLKRKGRHTKMNDLNDFKASVVENVNDIEIQKKRGRKKKDEKQDIEIEEKDEKGSKNDEKISKNNEKISNDEKIEKSPMEQVKLVRRNALMKTRESKVCVEKSEINNKIEAETSDLDSRARRNKVVEENPEVVIDTKSTTIERSRSRLTKGRKQFVVEHDEEPNPEENMIKIPGLAMLDKLKNRKSQLVKTTDDSSKITEKPKDLTKPIGKVPGLEMLADLKRRKSELVKSSSNQNEHEFIKPILPKISEKKPIIDTANSTPPKVAISVHPVTPIPPPQRQNASRKSKIPPMTSDKVPGLQIIEDLKRRKSEMLMEKKKPREIAPKLDTTTVAKKPNKTSATVSDIVPGLKDTEMIKKRKSESLAAMSNNILLTPKHAKEIDSAVTSSSSSLVRGPIHDSSVPFASRNTPDQLDTNIRFQCQQEQQKEQREHPDNYLNLFDRPINTPPTNIKFISSIKSPMGILSRPSPFKRPISALDDEEQEELDGGNNKMPKLLLQEPTRRQSVTFNREVSVKEIHGNSFNSIDTSSDEMEQGGGTIGGTSSGGNIEQLLNAELERVKHKVNVKHNENTFSRERQRIIGPSAFNRIDSKKSSDLSGMISNRIKLQSNSPPRHAPVTATMPPIGGTLGGTGGAIRKINQQQQQSKDFIWKSFSSNPVAQQQSRYGNNNNNNMDYEDDEDNSMEVDKKEEESKQSNCLIM